MPQEIRVLHCFNCKIFQVDIVKKSPKWQCRVCNTKQAVRKEYFRGTGAECRNKVQELNMTKGLKHNESVNTLLDIWNEANDDRCSLKENNVDRLDGAKHDNNISRNEKCELSNEKDFEISSSTSDCNMMFDFSQTTKWSNSNDSKMLTSTVKKSKWDNYM